MSGQTPGQIRRFDGRLVQAELDRQLRTREEVAVRAGVSTKTIDRWCRGEHGEPRRLLVRRVAEELGVTPEAFYSEPEMAA